MRRSLLLATLLLAITGFLLSGCNFIERNSFGLLSPSSQEQPPLKQPSFHSQEYQQQAAVPHTGQQTKETTRVAIEPAPQAPPKKERVEIIWEIPSVPVDHYILRYGPTPENLSSSVEIQTSKIEQITDPTHGKVYRYVIQNVSTDQKVFVSMASKKDGVTSSFSTPFEVGE